MRTVLHIGLEKTGTTSIQRMLRANKDVLSDRGFATSAATGRGSDIGLLAMALPEGRVARFHRNLGLRTAREVHRYRESLAGRLQADTDSQTHTWLFSCEQLSFQAASHRRVERLVSWLTSFGGDVEVLVYLRRQDRLLESSYQQRVKSGSTELLAVPSESDAGAGSKYDFFAMLERWAEVVGRQRITARVFEPEQLEAGDVIRDYLAAVGLGVDGLAIPERTNESLAADTLEFLRRLNAYLPSREGVGRNAQRGNISFLLRTVGGDGPPLRLAVADARDFLARFEDGNRRVAREYLDRPDGRLFRPVEDDPPRHAAELSLDRAVELTARLWLASNARSRAR